MAIQQFVLILFLPFLIVELLYVQNDIQNEYYETTFDSTLHKRIYRISYSSIHTVELIESKGESYKGQLITVMTRYRKRKSKDYIQRINISDSSARRLMRDLEELNIETAEDCGSIMSPDYDCVGTLDGDGTGFVVQTHEVKRKYSFDGLYPGAKDFNHLPEKQKAAQRMLNSVDEKFKLEKNLRNFMSQLPPGTYGYYGINLITLKKR